MKNNYYLSVIIPYDGTSVDNVLAQLNSIKDQVGLSIMKKPKVKRVEVCLVYVGTGDPNAWDFGNDWPFDIIWAKVDDVDKILTKEDLFKEANKVGLEETAADWIVYLQNGERFKPFMFRQWWWQSSKAKCDHVAISPHTLFIKVDRSIE